MSHEMGHVPFDIGANWAQLEKSEPFHLEQGRENMFHCFHNGKAVIQEIQI